MNDIGAPGWKHAFAPTQYEGDRRETGERESKLTEADELVDVLSFAYCSRRGAGRSRLARAGVRHPGCAGPKSQAGRYAQSDDGDHGNGERQIGEVHRRA